MSEQNELFNFDFEPIKGYPELRWAGKRPFTGTPYYPAQLKESHGSPSDDGWMNKLYWGDNLQVMSHLLKEYRGKVKFIYIDPPYDSKADYKKKIELKGSKTYSDNNSFEEKQYGDIWTNDEYLQFMYERLIILKELLSDDGCIMIHCDFRKASHLRLVCDDIFGGNPDINLRNEIIWSYRTGGVSKNFSFGRKHDDILFYSKTIDCKIKNLKERQYLEKPFMDSKIDSKGRYYVDTNLRDIIEGIINIVEDEKQEKIKEFNTRAVLNLSTERVDYPTQKPEGLIELLMTACTNPGDIVFDCFMGSGTTQAVAMKLGRRFLGADINLGAIQTTTKRLINRAKELESQKSETSLFNDVVSTGSTTANTGSITTFYTGFEVYNVNDYEFFRNELEAKRLIIEALGMQALPENNLWDAELDGRMVAILGINRIATASEFEKIIANIDIASWQKRQAENPDKPVEAITFVCMGHDPNLQAMFIQKMENLGFKVDLQILDILKDKKDLRFKRDSDAKIIIQNGKLIVEQFYPMNLLQKLSIEKQDVSDWKELTDSIMIDWNYDGVTFSPTTTDIPEKNQLVKGEYEVPSGVGQIHVKITDLISESWEGTFNNDGTKEAN